MVNNEIMKWNNNRIIKWNGIIMFIFCLYYSKSIKYKLTRKKKPK